MERLLSTAKIILCLLTLLAFNSAYAAAGCCSHHGGVNGCNTQTNHDLCKDGTTSPTCLCSGGTSNNTVTKTKKATQSVTQSNSAATSTSSTTATPAAATTTTTSNETTTTTKTKKSSKGCCAKHGGVAGCDASGFSKCKDGSVSSTCKC
jgi:hypothetical protein